MSAENLRARVYQRGHKPHRWVAITSYLVSDEAVRANVKDPGAAPLVLDHENIAFLEVGCWDCEQPYEQCRSRPCGSAESPIRPDTRWRVTSMGYTERLDREDKP